MSKERFILLMVSCLFGFILSGNANCVTGQFHAWWFGDRFFAFNCCKKDKNNTVNFSERTLLGAVKTLSAPSTIHWKTYFFEKSARIFSETNFTFFSANLPYKHLCPRTYASQPGLPMKLFEKTHIHSLKTLNLNKKPYLGT